MAKNPSPPKKVDIQLRPGEGTLVSATTTSQIGVGGETQTSLTFDLTRAPVPSRRYASEVASVEAFGPGGAKLMFAQRRIGGGFRSMVVIQLSAQAIQLFLTNFDSMTPKVDQLLSLMGQLPTPLCNIDAEPDQTIEVVANFSTAAVANLESCVDFYHASAFSMQAAQSLHKLAIEPVVRIDIGLDLLASVISELTAISKAQGKK